MAADDDIASRFLVRGHVQGVFFRASAQVQAQRLGLRGYARNLPDGGVEVVAVGVRDAVDELAAWLAVGPPRAQVTGVERSDTEAADAPAGFEVRR